VRRIKRLHVGFFPQEKLIFSLLVEYVHCASTASINTNNKWGTHAKASLFIGSVGFNLGLSAK
jgi:hypothetical protein